MFTKATLKSPLCFIGQRSIFVIPSKTPTLKYHRTIHKDLIKLSRLNVENETLVDFPQTVRAGYLSKV